ncbi:50S ribosomal protein L24 [Candidatus Desantisbacteria bacterium CG2_30_40_21]|uniref:Large ribosomal subunit protein uL24 n=5 Tax=unclassified Candidatus Desantisiibacteriota TaxID=3106372 RepID=A0A2M7JF41_9BACT|nr:ribosomal protein L24 [uncultured bacterium]OIP43551.1 MAG: 50S ribosomal protein L24 [Candidatus Desantisbacteria bacterium CG2_30_40_21]PIP39387.1 MAG: 50S ribosomal protein L24 [Candidatus Desantisbacteria bacterium CG23_combo_of_CG06-09_8_20_14_all_40_23]PIX17997.1 MAG: 50S ribosomal protein L24 [Candidatus Desantisbacteria bacterium CG_4_8_14_3_um_filter_40_12]PIY19559.1 MAG: 50S ribosomal protein L24 [Candidatus Desantisbacteria bacterium CG_4_10_14_3_um_filter_40_18]PJB30206.1 MAG: 5
MNRLHVKKGDKVEVIAGKDKGKKGKILHVFPDKQRVLVEGANMIKKHTRPNPQKAQTGGIVTKEASLHVSNVMFICPNCNRSTRLGHLVLEGGTKSRICRKCSEIVDKEKK